MAKFTIAGESIELPGDPVSRERSKKPTAWKGGDWTTVRLISEFDGIRVHTDGVRIDDRQVDPSGEVGRWILIGDVIFTSYQIVRGRALPGPFTTTSLVRMQPETVLNIGICGPAFTYEGGNWQAEFVSGPQMTFTRLPSFWMNQWGNA